MDASDGFFDTSVLLYLLSSDAAKAERAERLLERPGTISVQVLNELAAVGRGKLGLSFEDIAEVTGTLRALCVVHPLTEDTFERGLRIAAGYGFSIYDSMIVAAALLAGCGTLWSEDLQHRQVIDESLTVRNPFEAP